RLDRGHGQIEVVMNRPAEAAGGGEMQAQSQRGKEHREPEQREGEEMRRERERPVQRNAPATDPIGREATGRCRTLVPSAIVHERVYRNPLSLTRSNSTRRRVLTLTAGCLDVVHVESRRVARGREDRYSGLSR